MTNHPDFNDPPHHRDTFEECAWCHARWIQGGDGSESMLHAANCPFILNGIDTW